MHHRGRSRGGGTADTGGIWTPDWAGPRSCPALSCVTWHSLFSPMAGGSNSLVGCV